MIEPHVPPTLCTPWGHSFPFPLTQPSPDTQPGQDSPSSDSCHLHPQGSVEGGLGNTRGPPAPSPHWHGLRAGHCIHGLITAFSQWALWRQGNRTGRQSITCQVSRTEILIYQTPELFTLRPGGGNLTSDIWYPHALGAARSRNLSCTTSSFGCQPPLAPTRMNVSTKGGHTALLTRKFQPP